MLSSYDRVVITGTVPVIYYAEGMTRFLYAKGIRIFDYPKPCVAVTRPAWPDFVRVDPWIE